MQLTEWSDLSVFKEFCLDRLALGLSPELISSELSQIVGHSVPVEQVVSSCSLDEVKDRKLSLLKEARDSSPVISRELLTTLGKIKKFLDVAEEKFEESPKEIEDFDAYRRSLELKLKALETSFKQFDSLVASTKESPTIVLNFDFSKLKSLEDEGLIKIIDVDTVKELVGDGSEQD